MKGHPPEVERHGLLPSEPAPRRSRPFRGEVERVHQLEDPVPVEAKPGAALLLDDGVKAPRGAPTTIAAVRQRSMASVEGVERVIARFSRARFCACAEVNEGRVRRFFVF